MSKVTSKLQVTLPKKVADQFGIRPGDQIDWQVAGDAIRVIPVAKKTREKGNLQARLRLFDQATEREKKRARSLDPALLHTAELGCGWRRDDLYNRAGTRLPKSRSRKGRGGPN
jgi:AbrB family looped-hinge helix DNA binding protein